MIHFVPLSGNSIELYVEAKYKPLNSLQRKVLQKLLNYSFEQKACFTPSAIHYLFDAVNKESKVFDLDDRAILSRLNVLLKDCDKLSRSAVSRKRITRVLRGHTKERPWL